MSIKKFKSNIENSLLKVKSDTLKKIYSDLLATVNEAIEIYDKIDEYNNTLITKKAVIEDTTPIVEFEDYDLSDIDKKKENIKRIIESKEKLRQVIVKQVLISEKIKNDLNELDGLNTLIEKSVLLYIMDVIDNYFDDSTNSFIRVKSILEELIKAYAKNKLGELASIIEAMLQILDTIEIIKTNSSIQDDNDLKTFDNRLQLLELNKMFISNWIDFCKKNYYN